MGEEIIFPAGFCCDKVNELQVRHSCTATEMIPTIEMIPAVSTEMIPGISGMEY